MDWFYMVSAASFGYGIGWASRERYKKSGNVWKTSVLLVSGVYAVCCELCRGYMRANTLSWPEIVAILSAIMLPWFNFPPHSEAVHTSKRNAGDRLWQGFWARMPLASLYEQ